METHNGGRIEIEEDVSIGQNFHITASGENPVKIGKKSTILGNVFITNIDHEYQRIGVHILKQPFIEKKTEIGENCFIGYGACIQAGTILGKQCIVGANAVVRGVFPDYCVIVGVPARVVKQYNTEAKTWNKISIQNKSIQNKSIQNKTNNKNISYRGKIRFDDSNLVSNVSNKDEKILSVAEKIYDLIKQSYKNAFIGAITAKKLTQELNYNFSTAGFVRTWRQNNQQIVENLTNLINQLNRKKKDYEKKLCENIRN